MPVCSVDLYVSILHNTQQYIMQLLVGFLLISMSGSDMSHPGEKKAANKLNSVTTVLTVIISVINILLAAAVDHNQLRTVKNRGSECDQRQKGILCSFFLLHLKYHIPFHLSFVI